MREFATKIVSRQNSVNQYFGMQIHIFIFGLPGVLFGILGVLFGVLGDLFGIPGVLVGVCGVRWCVWRILYIFWHKWCLWHWDVVFVTFKIWNGAPPVVTIIRCDLEPYFLCEANTR